MLRLTAGKPQRFSEDAPGLLVSAEKKEEENVSLLFWLTGVAAVSLTVVWDDDHVGAAMQVFLLQAVHQQAHHPVHVLQGTDDLNIKFGKVQELKSYCNTRMFIV